MVGVLHILGHGMVRCIRTKCLAIDSLLFPWSGKIDVVLSKD
jgi:hypothetical protein